MREAGGRGEGGGSPRCRQSSRTSLSTAAMTEGQGTIFSIEGSDRSFFPHQDQWERNQRQTTLSAQQESPREQEENVMASAAGPLSSVQGCFVGPGLPTCFC